MPQADTTEPAATVAVENIGGISETEVKIPQGITVLSGRNATNRTSLLQAIMAVIGSDDVSLKGNTDEGRVELQIDDETYQRTLERAGNSVAFGGNQCLENSTVADLFAFLLGSNEARRAVVQGDDLRELLMRPVDTDAINAEIEQLESERRAVEEEVEELNSLKQKLPSLEERKQRLGSQIEDKRSELEAVESDIEAMDADVQERRTEKQELESRLEDLRDLRSELEQVRADIDVEEESLSSLRSERADVQNELESVADAPMGEIERIEDDVSRLRNKKQRLESLASTLQNVIQFNEEVLEGNQSAVSATLESDATPDEAVTDQLLTEDELVCWTCGSEVLVDQIEETLADLRDVRQNYTADIKEIEADITDLREEKREYGKTQRRKDDLERRLSETETEIEDREERVADLRERRDELSNDIETAEAEVEALESDEFSEILDLHKEANQLEFELGKLESDYDDVTGRISTIEDRLADEEDLQNSRKEISSELENQRTRIEQLEREAVEEFNDRMEDVLEALNYENLTRIWIERVQRTVREGRKKVEKSKFELHVVRTTESGTNYEDTIDHLSESEREVTGLTFALAGYLVHDLYETVPFMLLDSLEAIDSDRIANLISYFAEYPQHLVVALLPEDAERLPEEYNQVTDI
jgi:chromosome segregation ATPase